MDAIVLSYALIGIILTLIQIFFIFLYCFKIAKWSLSTYILPFAVLIIISFIYLLIFIFCL